MSLTLTAPALPLATDADGVIRVAGTRVTLDTVWSAFESGASAEEIVEQYPALDLADVDQVIGYCLTENESVRRYLSERQVVHDRIRQEVESTCPQVGIRARLMARRSTGAG